jgi:transposase-like protein
MTKTKKTTAAREAIIAEYLLGKISFRALGKKHEMDFREIHHWVQQFTGKTPMSKTSKNKIIESAAVPSEVKQLQEQLRMANLHVELLNTLIDIAEKDLKISIRKKPGTKR